MSQWQIKLIDNKIEWENLVSAHSEANFLQSRNWGEFHKNLGKRVYYLAIFNASQCAGAALAVREEARRGTYLTVAGGPLMDWKNERIFEFFSNEIKRLAQEAGAIFIRMRPQEIDTLELRQMAKKFGWLPSPMHLTSDLTLQLDLTKSEEELLRQMRKTTRYEIKHSEKIGIYVTQSKNPEDIKIFYEHQVELAKKHGFVPFSYNFLYQQFLSFIKDDQVLLFHSWQKNKLLSSAFVIFYNKEAAYHYGISTIDNQKLPGSYACQWAAIREAKKRDMKFYNFWGITHKKSHRFAQVSLFKTGFGGQEVAYLPSHDLPVRWRYYITRAFEYVRKKLRKL